jgi:biopolymer transport protein ExbD
MKLRRATEEPEIPTASMADIAFLLIVFFMITSVFAETAGVNFSIPQQKEEEEEQDTEREEAVNIRIDPSGQILADNNLLDRSRLGSAMREYLAPKLQRWPEKPILVTAEEESPYGAFVEAYDALRRTERALRKDGTVPNKLKVQILSLAEINRLKAQFGEDIFR